MSYEGFVEKLCARGHLRCYDYLDDEAEDVCSCGAAFVFRHDVDESNMIEFNFKLNDTDASNLISILHDAKVSALDNEKEYHTVYASSNRRNKVALANADWYKGYAEYLEGLKQKVLVGNKRVP